MSNLDKNAQKVLQGEFRRHLDTEITSQEIEHASKQQIMNINQSTMDTGLDSYQVGNMAYSRGNSHNET